uniref:class I SAM-dependent methyltransferase n=1 Tax=Megasphaera elsdenii TaxID=907 RepID=UPI0040281187
MIYVVPSLKAKEKLQSEGKAWAESQGFTYVLRHQRTIQDLMDEYGEDFLVYSSRGPQIDRPEGSHFFSLNMAELRIQNLRKGQCDHLLEALMGMKEREGRTLQSAALTAPLHRGASRTAAAQPPITILDCTCGFGADAAVVSFGLPTGSRVDALEVSPLLEAVTSWGFSHFVHKKDDVTAALRRISLRRGDYRDYLLSDEGPVYDVLYFDPMFQRPVEASCQFQPVRAIMEHGGLTRDLIERALQKARRRVVIKERDFRQLCRDFPEVTLYGGKYSRIGYAVLECDSWKK